MTDVFHYPGETNPNDVRLRNPTSLGVNETATLASTEAPDTAAFNAVRKSVETLAVVEAKDVAALTATHVATEALAATEAADISALAGLRISVGTMDSTEAPDIAAFTDTGPSVPAVILIRGGDDAPKKRRRKSSREQVDELLERVQKEVEHTELQKAAVEVVSEGVLKKDELNMEEDDEEVLLALT